MFTKLWKKRKIKNYINQTKQTPKAYSNVHKLQLIIFLNKDVPYNDQIHHLTEVLTSWTYTKSNLKNTQTWYNQKINREDNIIIYGVEMEELQNIINQPGSKTISCIGNLPIAVCLGLCFDNENQYKFERINV